MTLAIFSTWSRFGPFFYGQGEPLKLAQLDFRKKAKEGLEPHLVVYFLDIVERKNPKNL